MLIPYAESNSLAEFCDGPINELRQQIGPASLHLPIKRFELSLRIVSIHVDLLSGLKPLVIN